MRCPLANSESIDESTLRFFGSFITHIENVSPEVRAHAGAARHIENMLIKALDGSNEDSVNSAWRELYAEVYQILSMAAPSNGGSYRYLRTFLIENVDLMEAPRTNAPVGRCAKAGSDTSTGMVRRVVDDALMGDRRSVALDVKNGSSRIGTRNGRRVAGPSTASDDNAREARIQLRIYACLIGCGSNKV